MATSAMPKVPGAEFYEALKSKVQKLGAGGREITDECLLNGNTSPNIAVQHLQLRMLGVIATALIDIAEQNQAKEQSVQAALKALSPLVSPPPHGTPSATAPVPAANNVITCAACGNPYSTVSFDRCPGCEAPVPKLSYGICPNCGVTFNPALAACPGCGINKPEVTPKEGS